VDSLLKFTNREMKLSDLGVVGLLPQCRLCDTFASASSIIFTVSPRVKFASVLKALPADGPLEIVCVPAISSGPGDETFRLFQRMFLPVRTILQFFRRWRYFPRLDQGEVSRVTFQGTMWNEDY
jgi:hypothetical protein